MASIGQTVTRQTTGVAAGLGGTTVVREWFDTPNDTSLLRPSVLWGVGTGLGALGAVFANEAGYLRGIPDTLIPVLKTWGLTGTTAGVFSAAFPKGASESVLPLQEGRRRSMA